MADEIKNVIFRYITDASGMAPGSKALKEVIHEEERIKAKVEEATRAIKNQGEAFETASKKAAGGTQAAAGSVTNLNSLMKSGAQLVAGYFAFDQIVQFGAKVITVTAEMSKLNAVLKNAIGSQGAANQSFKMLNAFVDKNGGSVKDLTQTYVNLINRGIKPTSKELLLLSDLANSQGKNLDQFTEALLDAMTGEFERLKEFGVTASAQGDKVAFTFKGITTEVERTDESIKNYVLSLGSLEGVTGSTAAISETLEGQLQKLSNSVDKFYLAVGKGSEGIMTGAVKDINGFVEAATKGVKALGMLGSDGGLSFMQQMEVLFSPTGISDNKEWEIFWDTPRAKGTESNKVIESHLDLLKRLKKEATEQRDKLAIGTPPKVFNDLNIQIELYDEQIKKLTTIQGIVKQSGISPIKPKDVQLIKETALELDNVNRELKEIEYTTNPANTDMNNREFFADMAQEWLDFHEAKVRVAQEAALAIQGLANVLFQNDIQENEERLDALEEYYAREFELAGDNARAKGELEQEYQARKAEIEREIAEQKRKQAIFNKAVNIAEATANTALAVIRALADAGPFGGPAFAAAFAAIGAIQIATIAAQKIPKYKDGVLQLQGPGTETSDSIPVYASKGESIVSARRTRENLPLLKAIHEDRMPEWMNALAESNFDLARLNFGLPPELMAIQQQGADLSRLEGKFDKLTSVVERLPLHVSNFDENGFSRYTQQGNATTRYLNKRHT